MIIKLLKSKYELTALVAEDIFSFTYMAKQLDTENVVTVVKFKQELLSPDVIRRLILCAEKLMTLRHDTLREMYDYYYDGKFFYIVYEYDKKYVSLETLISKKESLSLSQIWSITTQVLSGLRFLESHDMVHGNLNLRSILLSSEGKVKLSKVYLPIQVLTKNFNDFPVIEDCIFYPPEFIQKQRYTVKSDIYGYGMLLYSCFSNQWPYPYSAKVDELRKSLLKPIKSFEKSHPRIPERLKTVIDIALQKDEDKRFSDFSELIAVYKGKDTETVMMNLEDSSQGTDIEDDLKQSLSVEKQTRFKGRVKLALVSACTAFLFFFSYITYMNYLTEIPSVVIPDIQGLSEGDAIITFENAGLSVEFGGERFHSTIEQGLVINTKPHAGREVKANRSVRYFVSKGKIQLVIPDLIGRTIPQSESILGDYKEHLVVSDQVYSPAYQKGIIIEQIPSANAFLGPSENIQVVISHGFPVHMNVKNTSSFFFQKRETLRLVSIGVEILEAWEDQTVSVFVIEEGQSEKIFSRKYRENQKDKLRFELDLGVYIEVYFNDELAFKQQVKDPVKPVEKEEEEKIESEKSEKREEGVLGLQSIKTKEALSLTLPEKRPTKNQQEEEKDI